MISFDTLRDLKTDMVKMDIHQVIAESLDNYVIFKEIFKDYFHL